MNRPSSWKDRVSAQGSKDIAAAPEGLPLFHERPDNEGLDALGRSFNQKRWPDFNPFDRDQKDEKAFSKALLIRQMHECLHRAPKAIKGTPEFEDARLALHQFDLYSSGVHASTHMGRKDWCTNLEKQFLELAKKVAPLCGSEQVRQAYQQDNERADGGKYPLWGALHQLPRELQKAEYIGQIAKEVEALGRISHIDEYQERREAYGRWLKHTEPLRPLIEKFSDKPGSHEESVLESMDNNAEKAKPLGMLVTTLNLKKTASNAEERLFSPRPLNQHCLVGAYREDRKGCKVRQIPPFKFDTIDAKNSAVMNVVFTARWGALAERIAGTLRAQGPNVNNPMIATKNATEKVDELMDFCNLKDAAPAAQASKDSSLSK